MTNECVICFTNIDNYNATKYYFQQECTCFYNVHSKCLVEWIDKYKICIHCYRPLSYNITNTHNVPNIETINETNSLVRQPHQPFKTLSAKYNIFKCCNLL